MEKNSAIFKYLTTTNLAVKDEEYQILQTDKKTGEKAYIRLPFTPTTKLERLLTILFYKVVNEFLKDKGLASTTLVIEQPKFARIKDQVHSLVSTFEDVYDSLFVNKATVGRSYRYLNFELDTLYNLIGKDLYTILDKTYKNNLSSFPIKENELQEITKLVLNGYRSIIEEFKLASNIRKTDKYFQPSYFKNNTSGPEAELKI